MTLFDVRRTATPTSDEDRRKALADPAFGRYYVDHMAIADYTEGLGWQNARIEPMSDFAMHPAAAVLHYGQEIFEGLKAYRREDDSVWLFRPEKNAARFVRSAQRLGMAPLPEELFLAAVTQLVELEAAWVPSGEQEQSLYIRPFQIASEPYLGVREANNYRFAVIASPAGPYYSDAMKLWVTPNFTRSAPGGTGTAKCGGNYAASLIAAQEAYEHGCGQVLWTDGAEHKWLEECGTMNVMMVTSDDELLTPALGTILDGVTRDSILKLAPDHGLTAVERAISVDELLAGLASGYIKEVFACGTAAVVTPIVGFNTPDRGEYVVGNGAVGPMTQEIRAHLVDIQFGRAEDTHGWTVKVA